LLKKRHSLCSTWHKTDQFRDEFFGNQLHWYWQPKTKNQNICTWTL